MTFAAVGTIIQSQAATFSLTPGGTGNLILFEVINESSVTPSSLSSSNVTWTPVGTGFAGAVNLFTSALFAGKVTSTGAATVTITFSGTPAVIRAAGQEFSSTAGAWALDVQGNLDAASGSAWPSLTPAGAGELYFGFAYNAGSAANGSTSGYTYQQDSHSNGMAHNPACTAAAQSPSWADSGEAFGIMALVRETPAGRSLNVPQAVRRAAFY